MSHSPIVNKEIKIDLLDIYLYLKKLIRFSFMDLCISYFSYCYLFIIIFPQRHSNASQSLCEIIRLSRDQMFQVQGSSEPDPLLATLEK